MTRLLKLLALLLLCPFLTKAQGGSVTVTAIVKDPTGALYVNSQVGAAFIDPGTSGKLPLISGSVFQKAYSGYGTDSFARFSMTLTDNFLIGSSSGATGTSWRFSICYVDRQTCFVYTTPLDCLHNIPVVCTSNTMDLSAPIQAVAALLPSLGTGSGKFLYFSVPFTATPVFASSQNAGFNMVLTGNVTSSTVNIGSATAGLIYKFTICEDGVGGRLFNWPASFNNSPGVKTGANVCTNQIWMFNGVTWDLLADSSATALPRLQLTGTNLVTGDFGFSGWGTGATITSIAGSDSAFQFTITAGTTPSINPQVTLNYHDGPWLSITSLTPLWINGTGNASDLSATSTTSALTLTFLALPIATKTYTFSMVVTGTSNLVPAGAFVNPIVQNPTGPQTINVFGLTVPSLTALSLSTFNSGITGVGDIGGLDIGATGLANGHIWLGINIFPAGSLALTELAPCTNGQVVLTSGGVQGCGNASVTNVNGTPTTSPLNLGSLPVAGVNNLLGIWQYSAGNASVEIPITGNGPKVLSGVGSYTSTHSVVVDVNGNIVDSGYTVTNSGRSTTICTTGSGNGATCATSIPLTHSELDLLYKVTCSGIGTIVGYPFILGISKGLTTVSVTITNGANAQAVASTLAEIDCILTRP